jgi:hypothetical protein
VNRDDKSAAVTRALPAWAERLDRAREDYSFRTQQTREGRAVVAARIGGGPGPQVVITSDESEMLAALGAHSDPPRGEGCASSAT